LGRLEGKVAIVTGAARGQGAAEARRFAAEGAKVVLTDTSKAGEAVANEIGASAFFISHDVAEEAAWQVAVRVAVEKFGTINILVNNAAIYQPESIAETDSAALERHYRINQLGVFLGMRAVIQPMAAAGGGSIVNISSVAGIKGTAGAFAYSTSKWAVTGMTKCAALDLAPLGIRVNSVHPGIIDTPMLAANNPERMKHFRSSVPLRRFAGPEEVAELVTYLASDLSRYVTGSEFVIDGGIGL